MIRVLVETALCALALWATLATFVLQKLILKTLMCLQRRGHVTCVLLVDLPDNYQNAQEINKLHQFHKNCTTDILT